MDLKSNLAIACLCLFICGCNPEPESGTSEKRTEVEAPLQTSSRPGRGLDENTEESTPRQLSLAGLPIDEEFFVIQVAAVFDEKTAKKVSDELEACGYPAFQEKVQGADGKSFVRIRTGVFVTAYEASYSLEDLSARFKKPMLIKLDGMPPGVFEIVRVDPDRLSQVDKSIYYDHQLQHCRKLLSETAKRCLSEIDGRDFMSEDNRAEWKRHFITSQGLWEELLKSDARAMEMEMYAGSGAGLIIQGYQIRHTAERIMSLKERYGLN